MKITRQAFLKATLTGAVGAGAWVATSGLHSLLPYSNQGPIRIRPLEGVEYSASLLRFMETARFSSPRVAMRAIKDPNVEFLIEYVEETNG